MMWIDNIDLTFDEDALRLIAKNVPPNIADTIVTLKNIANAIAKYFTNF